MEDFLKGNFYSLDMLCHPKLICAVLCRTVMYLPFIPILQVMFSKQNLIM